ncbi:RDD family protein [Stenotrophomonas sp. 24(2023)]|uniref:RDD family protein n=1 Tax=Stenotrophomonas sp. 24(2023) TaxID=3068324 RepID=UPI0027DF50C1|nr:RDD family protein [Stenotrophomonas sp. 24(2023)]WMJ70660.1 RDD family protein [Stenotrophomonas sp. 24(2023)]
MTEWYYAEGQQRHGPFPVEDIRQRFQRAQLSLDTLVWREGMPQWAALRQVVDELGLQTLASASTDAGNGIDLRGDYTAIDNGTAPLPGTGALSSSPYSAPSSAAYAAQHVSGGEVVYAGFWKRVAAYLIDYVIVTVATWIVAVVVVLAVGGVASVAAGETAGSVLAQIVNLLVTLALGVAYYAGFHASRGGATPGKMAIGIKVVRPDGERITFLRGVGRFFATIVSSLVLCIGYVMAAFTDRKQALHDMMCDTVVVDRWAFTDQPHLQRKELGTATVIVLVLGGIGLLVLLALLAVFIGYIAKMA